MSTIYTPPMRPDDIIHWEKKNHKYSFKKWIKGRWRYFYDEVAGGKYKSEAEKYKTIANNASSQALKSFNNANIQDKEHTKRLTYATNHDRTAQQYKDNAKFWADRGVEAMGNSKNWVGLTNPSAAKLFGFAQSEMRNAKHFRTKQQDQMRKAYSAKQSSNRSKYSMSIYSNTAKTYRQKASESKAKYEKSFAYKLDQASKSIERGKKVISNFFKGIFG